jgi:CelD/BcsL family acetyltransferase involved in cellulose biosynthesis
MSPSDVGSGALTVEVVKGAANVLALAPRWDDLMSRARGAPAFLARAWVEPWIRAGRTGGEAVAVAASDGERLVALLVLSVRSRAGVRIATPPGAEQPCYHGLLLDPASPDAVAAVAEACVRESVFHVLRIDDVATVDAATQALLAALAERGFRIARNLRNPCPTILLGCTYDDYLARTKSGKSRQTLRRKEKKLLASGDVKVVHLTGGAIDADAMRRAAVVQDESWMRRRGAAVLKEPFYQDLTLSGARGGLAHLWLVTIDGEDAAFVYALVAQAQLHYVWTAFRLAYEPRSAGQILTGWTIRDACEMKVERYDFGHGDAEYKRFWSTDAHEVHRVVAGRGLAGATVMLVTKLAWRLAKVAWIRSVYRALRRQPSDAAAEPHASSPVAADADPSEPAATARD